MNKRKSIALLGVIALGVLFLSSCEPPAYLRDHPWLFTPVAIETKTTLCQRLDLPSNHRLCKAGNEVRVPDWDDVIRQKFPVGTDYSKIQLALSGYRVNVEEDTSGDKMYIYYLFPDFPEIMVVFKADPSGKLTEILYSPQGSP